MIGAETRVRKFPGINDLAEAQRGTLLLWMPFALALGIGLYFALRFEPGVVIYGTLVVLIPAGIYGARFVPFSAAVVLLGLSIVATGFVNAGFSAHRKSAPVLKYRYYGPIEGRIIAVDRSASDKPRITLDRVRLAKVSASRTPRKIRISLHYPKQFMTLEPGRIVMLTANLSPPSGPVEPGGFDFQRFAWFRALGAIGYSRTPVLEAAAPDQAGFAMGLVRLRMRLATAIRAKIDGQGGAFAAAILLGDRSAIAPEMLARLRASNLAHLLAISGLHMGLLTGFVFAVIRYGLALVPFLALRLPVKKIAAMGAFVVAVTYLFLSGGNVATQRAFVMVAVMLLAILLERRALTLRAVALAAVIVLLVRPESLIEAGFQMSFAATTALVAVFAFLRDRGVFIGGGGPVKGALRWLFALVMSSGVAGLATAPISAFHFNQIAQYGLAANLLSVPAMGAVVMPSAVVAILLTPLGLDGLAWAMMGVGIDWILFVAGKIAALNGAVVYIVKPATLVLALIASGALMLVLLRGPVRLVAIAPVLLGFWLWSGTERPKLLLSANGRLMGVVKDGARVLNRARGSGFVASNWLENDGKGATQEMATLGLAKGKTRLESVSIGGLEAAYIWQKDVDPQEVAALCSSYDLVILPQSKLMQDGCEILNKTSLKATGSIAIDVDKAGFVLTGARQMTGARLWSR
ncbi:MAG: ComEC family competence protein [Alphaproteobacteria bacterium]|nr:ComEC family competence protein [Alphaproteobacteria bacterium]